MTDVKIEVDDRGNMATIWNDDQHYTLFGVHRAKECEGRSCVIHNPSDHEYRDRPLIWDGGRFWRYLHPGVGGTVEDPDVVAYRESLAGKRIQCLNCNDVIQSKHRHDFVTCKCGATSVDGGSDYTRILGSQWGFFSDAPAKSVQ